MKKTVILFISGILISIATLEGVVRVISPFLGPPLTKWNTMEDAKNLKLEEFRLKYPKPQYLFMGNSSVLIGFNPSVFDTEANLPAGSSFNAGMNGYEIKTIRDFACGYILKEIQPKNLVVLFSNPGMATKIDYLGLDTNNSILEKYFYIHRYRNTFRDPMTINTFIRVLKFHNKRQGIVYRWADNLDDFGYTKYGTPKSVVTNPGWNPSEDILREESAPPSIEIKGMEYLIEIRDLSRARGGNLIIGTVPTLSFDKKYREAIEAMAKYLGVAFVQGNDAVGQGKYFQDHIHLNQQGATEFSKFLTRELPKLNSTS